MSTGRNLLKDVQLTAREHRPRSLLTGAPRQLVCFEHPRTDDGPFI